MRPPSAVSILACAFMTLAALPVSGQAPARDTRTIATPPRGTAELSVIVSTDQTPSQPMRRVSVAIQAGELDVPRIAVTNDEGRVVFRDLPAANYLVTASRPGYVRTFYGSVLPGRGPGVPVSVLEGQRVSDVRIRMLRGSVLTGVVRNSSGRPAPNQQVQATMVRSSAGEKRAVNLEGSLGLVTTDDRGVYRIFGLAPGDYIVILPMIALSGQDVRPMTAAELAWADKAVAGAGGRSPSTSISAAPAGAPMVKYAPVYYPGTAVAAEASVLSLGPNEERAGVDVSLVMVPTAQVSGRVLDGEGRPQNGVIVSIRPTRPDGLDLFSSLLTSVGRPGPDGTFTIASVRPGNYTLSARATPRTGNEPAGPAGQAEMMRQAMAVTTGGVTFTHWAVEDLSIQGRDVSDITLTLRPGMTVSGKVVYESTTKAPPTDFSRVTLALISAPTGAAVSDLASSMTGGSAALKVAADGTFSVAGVAPGRYRMNSPLAMMAMGTMPASMLSAMGGGWTLKSVLANGRDIADAPIEIRAGVDLSGVVVTFTDRPSELSGTVLDGAGRPTPGFPIVVFSTDRMYWTPGSRRVQQARPASDGTFTVTGLPAGEYFVCAVPSVDRTEVYDPAFLDQLVPGSFKITIQDGEKKTQDLKLGGG